MRKNLYFLFLTYFFNLNVNGQYNKVWQQTYLPSPHHDLYSGSSFIDSNDNLRILFTPTNGNSGNTLLKYDVFGLINCYSPITIPSFASPLWGPFTDNVDNFYSIYDLNEPHLLKYDSDCNFIWHKKDSISDGFAGYYSGRIAVAGANNFISLKEYMNLTTYHESGSLHKFDSVFNLQWTYLFPDTIVYGNNQYFFGMYPIRQNVYLQYIYDRFNTSLGFIDDNYLIKIDSLGNKIWSTYFNTGWGFTSITADDSDNIYFSSRSGLTDSAGVLKTGKIDSSGVVLWTSDFTDNPTEDNYNSKIALDNANNLYVLATTDFSTWGSYSGKIVLLKYDGNNGNLIWGKLIEGSDTSRLHGYNSANDLKIDHQQNILICGSIIDTIGVDTITRSDGILMQLDTAGNIIWSDTTDLGIFQNAAWGEVQMKNSGEGFYAIGSYTDTSGVGMSYLNLAYYCKNSCTVGIKELEESSLISVYPNPANNSCTITSNAFIEASLNVYDITGRKIIEQLFNKEAELNLNVLKSGIYLLEIEDKEGRSVKSKLIKN